MVNRVESFGTGFTMPGSIFGSTGMIVMPHFTVGLGRDAAGAAFAAGFVGANSRLYGFDRPALATVVVNMQVANDTAKTTIVERVMIQPFLSRTDHLQTKFAASSMLPLPV
jgi:hypothetical protein